jgi:hypothetical protein
MEDWVKSYQSPLRPYRLGQTIQNWEKMGNGEAEYCELWEIHDKRTGKIIVIATGHDKFLRNEPDLLQVDGLPFVGMNLVPSARTFWTTPDAYYLRATQAELTDITIQSQKQRRLSVLRFLYNRQWISDDEMQKALRSDVGGAIPFDNTNDQPLTNGIQFLQPPGNVLLYQEGENTRRNAREIIGMSSNQQGEYDRSSRRTASEAMIVNQNSMQRMSRRQIAVRNLYTEAFKKINNLIFTFWKTPRVAKILDPRSQVIWQQYTGEQLKADYIYKLSFSNDPPESPQQRRQTALSMMQIFGQDPSVDQTSLRRYVANAFNDVDITAIFKPGVLDGTIPPEVYQQLAEQQGGSGQGSQSSSSNSQGGGGALQNLLPLLSGAGQGGGSSQE